MFSLFQLSVKPLAWDMTEVTELREEVTQARATSVMTVARVTQAERMAQERAIMLASTLGEANEASRRVSFFESELVATR
jgi:hypothetical protein